MGSIKSSLSNHICWIDKFMDFELLTGKSLYEWFVPFIRSLTEDGAVPYLIDTHERFRASPLASTILWLSDAGLLPDDVLDAMQSKLLFLRDKNQENDSDVGIETKLTGDEQGWSLAEGVSIWSTSLSIIALIDIQSIGLKKAAQYKDSVIWLVQQQDVANKGWAYQSHRNCNSNVIMTSLALRAIALAQQNKASFGFTPDEERQILGALNGGYIYLKNQMIDKKAKGVSYWHFEDKPHCAATTWALKALKDMSNIENINEDIKKFYNGILNGCLNFAVSCIPSKGLQWQDEQIVFEAGAKYNKQKNYYSFSPTLLPQLFTLGLSPHHPKVINQIVWLVSNQESWKIKGYDQGNICAFTYAMIMATIVKWVSYVGTENSLSLLKRPMKKTEKAVVLIYGVPILEKSPVQIISKARLRQFIFLLMIAFTLITFGKELFLLVRGFIDYIFQLINVSIGDIVKDAITTIFVAAIFGTLKFVKKIIALIRRWRH